MPTVDVISLEKKKVGTMDLDDSVFGVKVNIPLVHQVIKAQLAGRRQGTSKTKTKGEVRGGGRKPFKQKGTGNARQGSTRSSINVGGGRTFGPVPRSYEQKTPKEMMRGALRSALSDRLGAKRLLVIDEFSGTSFRTKEWVQIFGKQLGISKALIIDEANLNLERGVRNIPFLKVLKTEGINVYDIVKHQWLVMSKKSVAAIQERLKVES